MALAGPAVITPANRAVVMTTQIATARRSSKPSNLDSGDPSERGYTGRLNATLLRIAGRDQPRHDDRSRKYPVCFDTSVPPPPQRSTLQVSRARLCVPANRRVWSHVTAETRPRATGGPSRVEATLDASSLHSWGTSVGGSKRPVWARGFATSSLRPLPTSRKLVSSVAVARCGSSACTTPSRIRARRECGAGSRSARGKRFGAGRPDLNA